MDVGPSLNALAAFEEKVGGAIKGAVAEVAHRVEAGAKERAPVKTGNLRRSLSVFGPSPFGALAWQASIGPTAVYGRRVELGYQGTDSRGRSYNQPGRPYLGPAFDHVIGEASAIFAAYIARSS